MLLTKARGRDDVEQVIEAENQLLVLQIRIIVDVYKHHHEFAAKAATFYLVATGFLAGYILRPEVTRAARYVLVGVVVLASILAIVGCHITKRWLDRLTKDVQGMAENIPLSGVDLFAQGRNSLLVAEVAAWVVLASAGVFSALIR